MAKSKHRPKHKQQLSLYRKQLEISRELAKQYATIDGMGHQLGDEESPVDTTRELNGMISHDKHEQLMDTFEESHNVEPSTVN